MSREYLPNGHYYSKPQEIPNKSWVCGYCSHRVSSEKGYGICFRAGTVVHTGGVYICPNCLAPTFHSPRDGVFPTAPFGAPVGSLPKPVAGIYEEARRCTSQKCFTGAVLLCRKILMNTAVSQGANEGLRFVEYVDFLSNNGYIPPNGKRWVDHIRTKGNEATHEIPSISENDARDVIAFTEMLLKFVYEFPAKLPSPT